MNLVILYFSERPPNLAELNLSNINFSNNIRIKQNFCKSVNNIYCYPSKQIFENWRLSLQRRNPGEVRVV